MGSVTRGIRSESIGFFLLLLVLFVAPLTEAIKNLLIIGLFIWWLSTRNIGHELRTAPSYVMAFILFTIVPFITLISSELTDASKLMFDVKGAVKFGIALLPAYSLAKINARQEKSITLFVVILVVGGLMACIDALAQWVYMKEIYPEIRGVGHVNQSALYMTIVMISGIALTFHKRKWLHVLGWITVAVSLCFLIAARSLNTFVVMICVYIFLAAILVVEKRYKSIIQIISSHMVFFLGFMLFFPNANPSWNSFKVEINQRIHGDDITSNRLRIFQTAFEIYDHHLWFGVGPDQFGKATSEARLRAELDMEGRNYDHEKHKFLHTNHGHNVWINVLVERGLIGIILVGFFFVSSGFRIFVLSNRILSQRRGDPQLTQLVFLSGATWIMLFVGGIANTTLHLEHGLIGVMLLVWSITSLEHRVASLQSMEE